jgi:hypothetical protein
MVTGVTVPYAFGIQFADLWSKREYQLGLRCRHVEAIAGQLTKRRLPVA